MPVWLGLNEPSTRATARTHFLNKLTMLVNKFPKPDESKYDLLNSLPLLLLSSFFQLE